MYLKKVEELSKKQAELRLLQKKIRLNEVEGKGVSILVDQIKSEIDKLRGELRNLSQDKK